MALAGGVHLIVGSLSTARVERFGALSPDGRCHVFDARANGTVRGEGGGVVVLKRLDRAVADGDRIYAVIRGSAVNHGTGEEGVSVPSQAAQQRVMRAALARARMDPREVQYVELHGTGTAVGDRVEGAAVHSVYGQARDGAAGPVMVGSIKTNIGHLEGAAGIAGLIKTALCIARGELVASLNFSEPNPAITWGPACRSLSQPSRGRSPAPCERPASRRSGWAARTLMRCSRHHRSAPPPRAAPASTWLRGCCRRGPT